METRFLEYLQKIATGDYKPAIKICWLNPDESVKTSFTEAMYDISGSINVTYQSGIRRTCSLTINNNKGQFPIDYNNIWIGQKFQIWAGIYLDDGFPYYISQGIFYITNPSEVYNPKEKTVTIQGSDKWCYLDGTLFGHLTGLYQTYFGTNLKEASLSLLRGSKYDSQLTATDNLLFQIDPKPVLFASEFDSQYRDRNHYIYETGDVIYETNDKVLYAFRRSQNDDINTYTPTFVIYNEKTGKYEYENSGTKKKPVYTSLDEEKIDWSYNDKLFTTKENVLFSPYTIKLESGKTLGDWYLETATILSATVSYDNFGYMKFEPMSRSYADESDENKIIAWNFNDQQKIFLGMSTNHEFNTIYNDIIVLGKVINGHQAKARLQNQDFASENNIYRIGIKTKPPFEDDMYYTDTLCLDLAKYYAKTEMAKNKKVTISSLPLYHLDVNQLVTVTIPEKNIINEKFLVTSFSIPLGSGTMSISCNNIRNFSNWTEVPIYA